MPHSTGVLLPNFAGERLRDFPEALASLLLREDIQYYDGPYDSDASCQVRPLTSHELSMVHTHSMIEDVRKTGNYEGAVYSAGAIVQAALAVAAGTMSNAFAFTGFGDHHAGRDFFGGGCYFNGAAIAIALLRRQTALQRFAILDTDSHHGEGTRDIVERDPEILHVCICSQNYEDSLHNVDVRYPTDLCADDYVRLVKEEFGARTRTFGPQMIFWEFGFDSTSGEYGDRGITPDSHWKITRAIVDIADELCDGRLVTILCGGSRRDYAREILPRVIAELTSHS